MAITVTQRPEITIYEAGADYALDHGWNAVGNPILYKFTTTSYAQSNYRLEIYVFDSNNTALNTEAFTYTPDSTGNIIVNISEILKHNLSPDINADLTTSTIIYTDNAYLKFYIKYKEVWTGSSNPLVSDSISQFYSVYGTMQIPSLYGGNMAKYSLGALETMNVSNFTSGWTNRGVGIDWTFDATYMSTEIDRISFLVEGLDAISKRARKSDIFTKGHYISIYITGTVNNRLLERFTAYIGEHQEVEFGPIPIGDFMIRRDVLITRRAEYIEFEGFNSDSSLTGALTEIIVETIEINIIKKWMTNFQKPVLWKGWPFLIAGIFDEENDGYIRLNGQRTPAETSTNFGGIMIDVQLSKILSGFTNSEFEISLTPWYHVDQPGATQLTFIYATDGYRQLARTDTGSGASTLAMKYFMQDGIFLPGLYTFIIIVNNKTTVSGDATSGRCGVTIVGSVNDGASYETVSTGGSFMEDSSFLNTSSYQEIMITIPCSKTYNRLGVYFYRSGSGVTSTINLDVESIKFTAQNTSLIAYDEADIQISETMSIEVREPCDNPIMLMARNSLGGVTQWLFDVSQEYDFDYGNNIKAKRMVLSTIGLTINQWEALQDFVSLGEVYRDNITEFSSATIKTTSRIGSQVYVVDQDGTKTGVIVIPTKNKTRTRMVKHRFELEIEYPNIFSV